MLLSVAGTVLFDGIGGGGEPLAPLEPSLFPLLSLSLLFPSLSLFPPPLLAPPFGFESVPREGDGRGGGEYDILYVVVMPSPVTVSVRGGGGGGIVGVLAFVFSPPSSEGVREGGEADGAGVGEPSSDVRGVSGSLAPAVVVAPPLPSGDVAVAAGGGGEGAAGVGEGKSPSEELGESGAVAPGEVSPSGDVAVEVGPDGVAVRDGAGLGEASP